MNTFRIFFIVALLLGSMQMVQAQQVDVQNKVEYSKEADDLEDLNVISPTTKVVKKVKKVTMAKKVADTNISIEDLQRMVVKKSSLHYRKQRAKAKKCFREVEDSCDSLKVN